MLLFCAFAALTFAPLLTGRSSWVAFLAPLLMLFAFFAMFFAGMRRFGFPFADIVTAADRVGEGDYSMRVREHGPPSLRSVARAFNSMTARLEQNEQQRRHLMADIAHELRTPLTVIQGRLEALIDGVYPRDDARLQELLDETRVVSRLVEDLRTLSNAESGALALQKESSDLILLTHDAVNAMTPMAGERGVSLRVEGAADVAPIDIDPLRIREVLINLLSNAIRHSPPASAVVVTIDDFADHVSIRVTDRGAGIAPEDLPHVFDRFYKGPSSHGSGLGLTIARNLVEAHFGQIRAESVAGEGTAITFTLPRLSPRA